MRRIDTKIIEVNVALDDFHRHKFSKEGKHHSTSCLVFSSTHVYDLHPRIIERRRSYDFYDENSPLLNRVRSGSVETHHRIPARGPAPVDHYGSI